MARGTRGRAYDNVPKVLSRRRKLQDARAGVVALERSASNRSMGSMGSMGSFGSQQLLQVCHAVGCRWMPLVSCVMQSGALDSSDFLQLYSSYH